MHRLFGASPRIPTASSYVFRWCNAISAFAAAAGDELPVVYDGDVRLILCNGDVWNDGHTCWEGTGNGNLYWAGIDNMGSSNHEHRHRLKPTSGRCSHRARKVSTAAQSATLESQRCFFSLLPLLLVLCGFPGLRHKNPPCRVLDQCNVTIGQRMVRRDDNAAAQFLNLFNDPGKVSNPDHRHPL